MDRQGNITIIKPPVTLSINFLYEGFIYNKLSSLNNAILLKTLRTVIRELGILPIISSLISSILFFKKITCGYKTIKICLPVHG